MVDGVIDRGVFDDRQHRPEYLLAHHFEVRPGIPDQHRRHLAVVDAQPLAGRIDFDDLGAAIAGLIHHVAQATMVALADDGGVVGIIAEPRIEIGHGGRELRRDGCPLP